ncbi:hypothetical protein CYMTET_48615 [Cymbomonas tetramitiformis]|uniref:Uncharacterized protein n=1 Tax=Cymbomonas tetramitiformis TaxID=36881 RepID=A0AAE0EWL7_9CHLO|nr:hypothetical protein CYMTET_48615 [Cymbomonas tetramitiformis]
MVEAAVAAALAGRDPVSKGGGSKGRDPPASLRDVTRASVGRRLGWTWTECERVITEIRVAAARQAADLARVRHAFGRHPAGRVEPWEFELVDDRFPACKQEQCGLEELHENRKVRTKHLYAYIELAMQELASMQRALAGVPGITQPSFDEEWAAAAATSRKRRAVRQPRESDGEDSEGEEKKRAAVKARFGSLRTATDEELRRALDGSLAVKDIMRPPGETAAPARPILPAGGALRGMDIRVSRPGGDYEEEGEVEAGLEEGANAGGEGQALPDLRRGRGGAGGGKGRDAVKTDGEIVAEPEAEHAEDVTMASDDREPEPAGETREMQVEDAEPWRKLESLLGLLAFCAHVVWGLSLYTRQRFALVAATSGRSRVAVSTGVMQDLKVVERVIRLYNGRKVVLHMEDVHEDAFATDASLRKGMGGHCQPDYFLVSWEDSAEMPQRDFYPFTSKAKSHINYLELFADGAYAESTLRSYDTGVKAFLTFCVRFACLGTLEPLLPGSDATLARFIAFSAWFVQPGTIKSYLAGVRPLHLQQGVEWAPVAHRFWEAAALQGVRRTWDQPARPVMPITLRDLARMAEFADMETITGLALWAAILVGFYGLFRKDNLTVGKSQAWNARGALVREDVLSAEAGDSVEGRGKRGALVPISHAVLVAGLKKLAEQVGLDPARLGGSVSEE